MTFKECLVWGVPATVLAFTTYLSTFAQDTETVEVDQRMPVVFAYAENDYAQKIPLANALELGFRFIEADTFLIDDRLMIGNSVLDLQSKGSLEALYFAPLERHVKNRSEQGGEVESPIMLVIDVKTDPDLTYQAIRRLLNKYANMLTKVVDGQPQTNAVTVVISGNCARERIAAENPRLAAIDGRVSDLESNSPSHMIPMISARWASHFRWLGKSVIPPHEKRRLQSMVERAHAKNRMIRFWTTPDTEIVWTELRSAGVDLIGAEKFPILKDFLIPRKSPFESEN